MLSAPALLALLDHLAASNPAAGRHGAWRYRRVAGGANNLVYRATSPAHDLAIKWAIRDERDRAGREYAALAALRAAGLALAPPPLLLDRERYAQPVVVQGWLPGRVLAAPPAGDAGWRMLLAHYLALHMLTPERADRPLAAAVLTMRSADDGLAQIEAQLARIPAAERPPDLLALVSQAARRCWPSWPAPPLALCRVDCNPANFIRRPGGWASVDWENSGWGDPAFELADMRAHPAYATVPVARWAWLIAEYAAARGEPGAALRARAYYPLMLVWWVARFARTLYEVPRGGDQRLARRPASWQATAEAGYWRYYELARAELDRAA